MPSTFVDDDIGYTEWLNTHPAGYVVNCDRNPRASYLMLHRANCRTISGTPARGDTFMITHMKVCADTTAELETRARAETGGGVQRCGSCVP